MFDESYYDPQPRPDRRAFIQERLKALGAFTCIAIGGVAGIEMVLGGGFDFITPGTDLREVAPSAFVSIYRTPWSNGAQVVRLSSTEPLFAGQMLQASTTEDHLPAGYDDPSAPDTAAAEVEEQDLRRQIDDLYANDSGRSYTEASITYHDTPAIDEPRPEPDPYAQAEAMVRDALGDYTPSADTLHPS